ncbi:MAG: hypothetical protein JXR64_02875 [Spirochaetales bacterium]|nr:hypothetical protein [Spirochaetales bacterium]
MEIKTIKKITPFLNNGMHRQIKDGKGNVFYQNIVTFSDDISGPVFTQNEKAPYDIGDKVEVIKRKNSAGKIFYSVKKITPFPDENDSDEKENKNSYNQESLRETHIAIAAVDKALTIYNMIKPKDSFILDESGVKQITEIAIDLSKIINEIEKNVF